MLGGTCLHAQQLTENRNQQQARTEKKASGAEEQDRSQGDVHIFLRKCASSLWLERSRQIVQLKDFQLRNKNMTTS